MSKQRQIEHIRVYRTFDSSERKEALNAGFILAPFARPKAYTITSPMYTILYLLDGHGWFTDDHNRKYELTPGVLVQRFPDTIHSVERTQDGKWSEFYIVFPSSFYNVLRSLGCIPTKRTVLYPGINELVTEKIIAFVDNLKLAPSNMLPHVLAEAHALLMQLFRMANKKYPLAKSYPLVDRGKAILDQHIGSHIHIAEIIATQLGVGYERFRKLFRDTTGISPQEYIIRRRIEKAIQLLTREPLSIKEIAFSLGYADVPSFVKQFKKRMGFTPAYFRDMHYRLA